MTSFRQWLLRLSIVANIFFIFAGLWAVRRMGGFEAVRYRLRHRGLSGLYENRKSLLDVLKVKSGDIIWLGDSLTEQGEWSELFGNCRHKNRGIIGDYTAGVLGRLDAIVKEKPEAIFIMVGINDLLLGATVEAVMADYEEIVKRIRTESPGTQILIQSVLPVNTHRWVLRDCHEEIVELNQKLKQLAQAEGISYLDIYGRLVDKQGMLDEKYTHDGIHLTGEAYLIWQKTVATVVEGL